MNKMNDVSLDIETLGVKASAVVLSIGAVYFDRHSNQLGDRFYGVLEFRTQMEKGRTIDPKTMAWWNEQSQQARDEVFRNDNRSDTAKALDDFYTFLQPNHDGSNDVCLWGNGATFDNAIVTDLYESTFEYKQKPWSYRNNRCLRTFRAELQFLHPEDVEFIGTPHNALADAVHQAKVCQSLFATLKTFADYFPPIPVAQKAPSSINELRESIRQQHRPAGSSNVITDQEGGKLHPAQSFTPPAHIGIVADKSFPLFGAEAIAFELQVIGNAPGWATHYDKHACRYINLSLEVEQARLSNLALSQSWIDDLIAIPSVNSTYP